MKRYAFIYNPAARGGNSGSTFIALKRRIETLPVAELFQSRIKGDITQLIERHLEDFDVFVACGGDGTVREVASKLINTGKNMGIIPMGTGNDLCKTLGIPTGLYQSLEMVFHGATTKIDVGCCNDFIFVNTLGFGFDGLTNQYAVELKHIHPFFRYAFAALKAAVHQEKFTVEIFHEGQSYQQELIMISLANGRVEGGAFCIAPGASVTDGKISLVTVNPIPKLLIPFLLPLFLFKKPQWIPHYQSMETQKLTLVFDRKVEIHADGEILKNNTGEFTISLIHKGLRIICGL